MTAIHQACAKVHKWFKSVEDRLELSFDKELHLLISFLLAWVVRGDIIENAWAVLPLVVIFLGKEFYDIYKPNPTGFSWKDLACDGIGGFIGYCLGAII